jgi:hypothetical protein
LKRKDCEETSVRGDCDEAVKIRSSP